MTVFLRLLQDADKAQALRETIEHMRFADADDRVFSVPHERFQSIPGSPFAYWVSDSITSMFEKFPRAESESRRFTKGLCTTDDFRFVRVWWEAPQSTGTPESKKWFNFANGSKTRPFYLDPHLLLNWQRNGHELKNFLDHKIGKINQWSRWINSVEHYFRPGVTWPLRSARFSPQILPSGVIFSVRSYAGFERNDQPLGMIGILSSRPFDYLFKISLGRFGHPEFVIGVAQKLPFPNIPDETKDKLACNVRDCWRLWRRFFTADETSHAFVLPASMNSSYTKIEEQRTSEKIEELQAEIDRIAFDLYGFCQNDRASVIAAFGSAAASTICEFEEEKQLDDVDDENEDEDPASIDDSSNLLSWAVGVTFGRFDWRLATGEREVPPEPDPFDSLPSKSPGMLPDGVSSFHEHVGILVEDQGHLHDLPRLIEEVLARIQTEAPGDVRRWLARDFFPFHLKRYSKSRRKAPIYWPLSTRSGSFTLWLYYPSLTGQTLYTAVNDFVEPKLKQVARDTATLRDKGAARSRDDETALEMFQTIELELIELRDTLLAIAPTYRPNQDDGVQITAAPLWQLFRHKPWQKILKDTWAQLEKGDYDWAHLAMAYWPDRVREKCKADRSLAIAHDLEQFYVELAPSSNKVSGRKNGRSR